MNWLEEYLSKKVDTDKIIKETVEVFKKSTAIDRLTTFSSLQKKEYNILHKKFLTPTRLIFDVKKFNEEILEFENYFESWGFNKENNLRQGLALVNQTGKLISNDPINGSLMEYNDKTNCPLLELDCREKTKVFDLSSLKILNSISDKWYRSNVLRWNKTARFVPHIDTLIPSYWIRLWAIDKPENIIMRYWNKETVEIQNAEPGRIYVIDTSLVHDAVCIDSSCYQLFLSLPIDSYDTLKGLLL